MPSIIKTVFIFLLILIAVFVLIFVVFGKRKVKSVILIIVSIPISFILLILFMNLKKLKSIISIHKVAPKTYKMVYYGDYDFNDLLKKNIKSDGELLFYLQKKMLGITVNKSKSEFKNSCTNFTAADLNGNLLSCHNEDFISGNPVIIVETAPKNGYKSFSLVSAAALGIFNDLGVIHRPGLLISPFVPFDGINEYGLTVSTLTVPGSGEKRDGKYTLGSLNVVRYLLDNAKNIDEAYELMKSLSIYYNGDIPVKYIIADQHGESMEIEVVHSELRNVRYKNPGLCAANFLQTSENKESAAYDSYERYDTVKSHLKEKSYKLTVDNALAILNRVKNAYMIQWSSVFNTSTGDIYITLHGDFNKVLKYHIDIIKD